MNKNLVKAINYIARIPGLNTKSATKILFFLLKNKNKFMRPLVQSLTEILNTVQECSECGFLTENTQCEICINKLRSQNLICVIENANNLYSIENSGAYSGKYHVLNGVISPIEGIMPEDLNIHSLVKKINIKLQTIKLELIFALPSDLNGNSTMNYIIDKIYKNIENKHNLTISVIARGVSINSDLDYSNQASINASIIHRRKIK